ncbi:MAG TPA: hypothetical protein DD726_10765 [Phycisphaerales bacterium]|nr:hypothetical protein [Phycisphaerales bacterium]
MKKFLVLVMAAVFVPVAYSDVKLAVLFCNGVVLQQKSDAPIWGWASPGEQITINVDWQAGEFAAVADEKGDWKVILKTPQAGGPYTIKVKGQNEIILSDVLIGEVWFCSGQSNMEVPLGWLGTERSKKDTAEANNPLIRVFDIKNKYSALEEKQCTGEWDSWRPVTPDNVQWFSAVGYYFGKRLQENLNVPVGLVSSHWGGTPAESWTDFDSIKRFPRFEKQVEVLAAIREKNGDSDAVFKNVIDQWLAKVALEDDGIKNKWFAADANTADWLPMVQPASWSGSDLKDVDGIVWFRKEFTLPTDANLQDLEINLGKIDDIDGVWLNGNYIGTTIGGDITRTYKVSAAFLNKGANIIAVRVIDTGGDSGFVSEAKDLKISQAGKDLQSLAGQWQYKAANPKTDWQMPTFTAINQNSPTALFNAMLAPVIPFRIAGVLWYQGESNVDFPIEYRELFPAMIENWRSRWGQGSFPFYYVQIAPWDYGDARVSQALREAQMLALSVPNTGMAVTMDIGDEKDIHPRNKHDVGDRLVRWALNKNYGRTDVVFSGPLYKEMKIDSNSIRLFFNYTDGGLVAKGGDLTDFTIAGEDKKFEPAKAVIDGNTIVVSSEQVKNPVAVRFAWKNWVQPNLFNAANLPASSFRTDDWPLQ